MGTATSIICLKGHLLTSTSINPEQDLNQKPFCSICGQPHIFKCPHCENRILGGNVLDGYEYIYNEISIIPAYCSSCGCAFPWHQEKLDTMASLFSMENNLNNNEKEELLLIIPDLLTQVPNLQTDISVIKARPLLKKLSSSSFEIAKSIITSVATNEIVSKLFS